VTVTSPGQQPLLWWCGPRDLKVGQTVEPGDYWRRVLDAELIEEHAQPGGERLAAPSAVAPAVLLEVALEWVRACEFPTLPSRARCLFTWEREDWGRAYLEHLRGARLYEVRPVRGARIFRAEYLLGSTFRAADTLDRLLERARGYWRGELAERAEVLVESAAVIERIVQ